jgi:hypothetical protein
MVANDLLSAAVQAVSNATSNPQAAKTAAKAVVMLSEAQAQMLLLPIGIIGLIFGLYQIMWLSNNTTLD